MAGSEAEKPTVVSVLDRECAILRASFVSTEGEATEVTGSDSVMRMLIRLMGEEDRLIDIDLTAFSSSFHVSSTSRRPRNRKVSSPSDVSDELIGDSRAAVSDVCVGVFWACELKFVLLVSVGKFSASLVVVNVIFARVLSASVGRVIDGLRLCLARYFPDDADRGRVGLDVVSGDTSTSCDHEGFRDTEGDDAGGV